METRFIYFRNEWLKLIRNPQIIWLVLIGAWTIVGWAWLFGQGGAVTIRGGVVHNLPDRLFPFFLLSRLVSLPIFSLVFFLTLHTERQNHTFTWLYRLPIEPLQWHIAKLLTAFFLCMLTMIVGLILAGGVLYWYSSDIVAEPVPFFTIFWLISRHLLLLPIGIWLTLYGLALFIRSPVVAVLIVLVLQMAGSFTTDLPNPFASLRLAVAHASAVGSPLYQPEVVGEQYLITTAYFTLLLFVSWLLIRWQPVWLTRFLPY